MLCPKCGKKLPDNAAMCKKCGTVFKTVSSSNETAEYIKKEREKDELRQKNLEKKKEKKSKKPPKEPRDKSKTIKVLAIIAIVCAVVGAVFACLIQFGVFDKKKEDGGDKPDALLIEYTYEEATDDNAVLKLGDINISEEEYEFFFRQSYSTVQNNAQLQFKEYVSKKLGEEYNENTDYYDEYFEAFMSENPNTFDFKAPINEQETKAKDSDGNTLSWQDYIRNDALKTMSGYRVKYALAKKAGLELTDDVRYQVYDHIEGLRSAVKGGGYSTLTQYLKILFGDSCDEEFFKNELIREYTASKYDSYIKREYMKSYSDEEVKEQYEKNYQNYDYIDLLVYEATGDNAKETADKIAAKATDRVSFSSAVAEYSNSSSDNQSLPAVPKYYIDQNYSSQLGEWAYSRERKEGDVSVFKTAKGYSVAMVQKPAYTFENCVSYREIVLNKSDENGSALTGEQLEALKTKAETIYDNWKKGKANEDSFIYYAISNSQGSNASSGGLYECATESDMNEEVKNWAYESGRTYGNTELLESTDAYRIVFFVESYGDYWNYAVRSEKSTEKAQSELDASQSETYKQNFDDNVLTDTENSIIKSINEIYLGIK